MKPIKSAFCLLLAAALIFSLPSCAQSGGAVEPPEYVPVVIVPDFGVTALVSQNGESWPLTRFENGASWQELERIYGEFELSVACDPKGNFTVGGGENGDGGYSALIGALEKSVGSDCVRLFEYDWRLDCRRTGESLRQFISKVTNETGAKRVNVIAHGFGGLILAEYLNYHKSDGRVKLAVTVGTPFLGMPNVPNSLYMSELAAVVSGMGIYEYNDKNNAEKRIKQTYMTFPSVYELAYYSRFGELGMIFPNGDLRDNATQAQASAYSFHFAIRENLASVFSGVKHVNIFGVGAVTEDDDYGRVDGDGAVTAKSADGNGAFAANGENYVKIGINASHGALMTDEQVINGILGYAVLKHER